jgi:hypothetical protein
VPTQLRLVAPPPQHAEDLAQNAQVTEANCAVFIPRVRRGSGWASFGPYRTAELARRVGAAFGRVPLSALVVARSPSNGMMNEADQA